MWSRITCTCAAVVAARPDPRVRTSYCVSTRVAPTRHAVGHGRTGGRVRHRWRAGDLAAHGLGRPLVRAPGRLTERVRPAHRRHLERRRPGPGQPGAGPHATG